MAQAAVPQLSNFCRKCGGKITMRQPPNENEVRHVCDACGFIDYYNPKLVRSVSECFPRSPAGANHQYCIACLPVFTWEKPHPLLDAHMQCPAEYAVYAQQWLQ